MRKKSVFGGTWQRKVVRKVELRLCALAGQSVVCLLFSPLLQKRVT